MTISEYSCRIRDGKLKPSELVKGCLNRIDQLNEQIRAWVCVDRDRALADAHRLGQEIPQGRCRGPLHGIPIGVKDIVDVQGLPTRAGSRLTSAEPVARDAAVVARLREAGAVILGKTVTTEYASFDPPPTRNPWNVRHTPGGSSSGSAAAVAAGMCLGAISTQTGGSIIRPASYCGVCGFKPSFNRLSLDGVIPLSTALDHIGPIAACVADLKLMLDVMSNHPANGSGDDSPMVSAPRLGLIESYFLEEADECVAAATREAIGRLQASGATVRVVDLPASFQEVHAMHRTIMAFGAAVYHRDQFKTHSDQYGPAIASLIREGLRIDRDFYRAALVHQRRFQNETLELFASVDVLVTPATPTPAPASLETTGDPKFNSPWTYTGLPTASIPCAVGADGLPLSLQLTGPLRSDRRLLAAAVWCEVQLKFDCHLPVTETLPVNSAFLSGPI